MKIEILGNPIPQQRTRSKILRGKSFAIHYDPQVKEKENVRFILKRNVKPSDFDFNEPLEVEMTFHMSFPKKLNRDQINAFKWGIENYSLKPDLDNLAKFYLDCMNEIIYNDDCQVKKLVLNKIYSDIPKTVIEIKKTKEFFMDKKTKKIISQFSPNELNNLIDELRVFFNKLEHYQNVEENIKEYNEISGFLFTETASFLNDFSKKYSKTLTKISKIKDENEL